MSICLWSIVSSCDEREVVGLEIRSWDLLIGFLRRCRLSFILIRNIALFTKHSEQGLWISCRTYFTFF